ncbi:YciI family protein [Labedaea rhizosphaerae]|uniref:YCII-related domain-containing protein n=1 Tax=Labedaea rhizosphaerae TaxID=598644 RepID=A0A4R6SPF4_LABRH|nr:YciI family protein [Labedaea rhizosphaerae]TDQ05362.1 hypothetical protein EV186_1011332 [Labedaea rhizosphaerae]
MDYLLFICGDESTWPDISAAELAGDPASHEWVAHVEQTGAVKFGAKLRPTRDAKTVRVRDGQVLVSDGPFAETAEQIGGLDLVEAPDLDHVLDYAARHPGIDDLTIEIRPLWPDRPITPDTPTGPQPQD